MMKETQELRSLTTDDLRKWKRRFARQVKNLCGEELPSRLRWAEYIMEKFQYYMPTKIIFGQGSLERIGQETRGVGERAMLVTGRRAMRKFGITERVKKSLKAAGREIVLFIWR